eukprot:scaffold76213_cov11-Tisochrysis_lutea.AAC.1
MVGISCGAVPCRAQGIKASQWQDEFSSDLLTTRDQMAKIGAELVKMGVDMKDINEKVGELHSKRRAADDCEPATSKKKRS